RQYRPSRLPNCPHPRRNLRLMCSVRPSIRRRQRPVRKSSSRCSGRYSSLSIPLFSDLPAERVRGLLIKLVVVTHRRENTLLGIRVLVVQVPQRLRVRGSATIGTFRVLGGDG